MEDSQGRNAFALSAAAEAAAAAADLACLAADQRAAKALIVAYGHRPVSVGGQAVLY